MTTVKPQRARSIFMSRAAEVMLRALGGCEVRLLVPGGATADATAQQLGLETGDLAEVRIAPVVVRSLPENQHSTAQYELLVAAETARVTAEMQQAASAHDLLATAHGVLLGQKRLRILEVATEHFAGAPYLFRVLAAE